MNASSSPSPAPVPRPRIALPLMLAVVSFGAFAALRQSEHAGTTVKFEKTFVPPRPLARQAESMALPTDASSPETDLATGLRKAPGWELVAANCSGCHSTRLVVQNRGDRAHWLSMIRWMQKTQNLWMLAPDVENSILAYLSSQYGEQTQERRVALPPHMMPPFRYPAPTRSP